MALAHKIPAHDTTQLSHKTQQALANLRLESFEISDETMEDIRLFDAQKMTKQELMARALKRAKS